MRGPALWNENEASINKYHVYEETCWDILDGDVTSGCTGEVMRLSRKAGGGRARVAAASGAVRERGGGGAPVSRSVSEDSERSSPRPIPLLPHSSYPLAHEYGGGMIEFA